MARMMKLLLVALVIGAALGHVGRPQRAAGQALQTLLNTDVWLTSVYQPPYQQTEVFAVSDDGAVWSMWNVSGVWRPPTRISPPDMADPGAPLAAIWQPLNNQVEVFFVGKDGTLWDVVKANNGPWQAPQRLTEPNFAESSSHVAAAWQTINSQLEVFLVDTSGRLREIWKANNGPWTVSPPLPSNASGQRGSPLGAIYWPPERTLEVFLVGRDGSIRHAFKRNNGAWESDTISQPSFAPSAAPIAPVYYPNGDAVEVFVVGNDGMLRGVWKQPGRSWQDNLTLSAPGFYATRAPISAVYQAQNEQLEVFAVGKDGDIWITWKAKELAWQRSVNLFGRGQFRESTPLVAVSPRSDRIEVFAADSDAVLKEVSRTGIGSWQTAVVTGPFLTAKYSPAECSRLLRTKRYQGDQLGHCTWTLGIAQYCQAQGAFVVETLDVRGALNGLACAPYSRPDSIGEQLDRLATGIYQGLETAFIAAAPYLSIAVNGVACVGGVLYSCAQVAVQVAGLAGIDLPGVLPEAIMFGSQVLGCAGGNITACAQAAVHGAKTAGIVIPGIDVAAVAGDVSKCVDGKDFAACARLGLQLANAAGVDTGVTATQIVDSRDCLAGKADACLALGGNLARLANFPLDRLTAGAQNAQNCANGNTDACLSLGREAARVADIPLGDLPKGVELGQKCAAGDTPACIALGRGAAQTLGIPLNVPGMAQAATAARTCATGDQAACTALGRGLVGSVVADGVENGRKCGGGDRAACLALGQGLAGAGLARDATKALRCQHGDFNACVDLGRAVAGTTGSSSPTG